MLRINHMKKYYSDRCLFENLSFEVFPGEKVGLIGINGCGKTSLFKIITGTLEKDGGKVIIDGRLGYLPQDLHFGEAMFPHEWLETWADEPNYFRTIHQMGVADLLWQPIDSLSGGEKTRVFLAGLQLEQPEVLLMDEPTNHLDQEGLKILTEFVTAYTGALLMISHDRHFLDRTANRIIRLEDGEMRSFKGNYSDYKRRVEDEAAHQQMAFERYVKTKAQLETAAEAQLKRANKFNNLSQNDFQRGKAKGVAQKGKALKKRVEMLEKVDKPKWVRPLPIYMNSAGEAPKFLTLASELALSYEQENVFKNVSFQIERTDRIALVGPNGSGKSSLLKALNQDAAVKDCISGSLKVSAGINIGYFSQELTSLDPEATLLEALQDLGLPEKDLRNFLGAMNFKQTDVFKQIKMLSYGEKARVVMLNLALGGYQLLLLDEPTNFLDVPTREKIEELLHGYDGAILFVSHDQYFIDQMAQEIWHLTPKGLHKESGQYDYCEQ